MAHIEYPGLPAEYVLEMVGKFYDEYFFRPKAALRVVWKAIVNRDVPRCTTEARSFMKLRGQRKTAPPPPTGRPTPSKAPGILQLNASRAQAHFG